MFLALLATENDVVNVVIYTSAWCKLSLGETRAVVAILRGASSMGTDGNHIQYEVVVKG